jgi:hypothetical protein
MDRKINRQTNPTKRTNPKLAGERKNNMYALFANGTSTVTDTGTRTQQTSEKCKIQNRKAGIRGDAKNRSHHVEAGMATCDTQGGGILPTGIPRNATRFKSH